MANTKVVWRVALVKGKCYQWSVKEYSSASEALQSMAKYVDSQGDAFNTSIAVVPQVRYIYEPKENGAQ